MTERTFEQKLAGMTMADLEGAALAADLLPEIYTDNDRALIRLEILRRMKEAARGKR